MLDTGGDDLHPRLGIAVMESELVLLLDATDTDGVGTPHDLRLGEIALHRLGIAAGGLDPRERVEGRDERHVELVLQGMPDDAAQPVVAVDHVGSLVAGEPVEHAASELVGDLRQRLLRQVVRTRFDVHHTVARLDDDLAWQTVTVGAGERGALDARLGQCRHQLAYVHVHATAVARARLHERGRVEGDHCDALHQGSNPNQGRSHPAVAENLPEASALGEARALSPR